ncbi:MAG: DUF2293 domain-containing protein [Planctomycetota bacterium]|jgi:hypothetical protein
MKKKREDIKVFISHRESTCDECKEELGSRAWITLARDKGALCLSCADLDHLVFLPSGDAALTRRSRKQSVLSAVVLKWARARKRYERQGVLVEETAMQKAEEECLADADARARRKKRAAEYRAQLDQEYVERFAARIREIYPACPEGREREIAEHACLKHSGRVGRCAAAKDLDAGVVRLAVTAHVRHAETRYDEMLFQGWDRWEARDEVGEKVADILEGWAGNL